MSDTRLPDCPLCGSPTAERHVAAGNRYFRCAVCALIHLDPAQHPSPAEARARYELHRNDARDPGYVRFLRELADPMIERLSPAARGLDFGCGPAPVLASLFTTAGFSCVSYDPNFAPDATLLERRYDFVSCSEVIEHVRDPAAVLAQLSHILAPGARLGVMTRFRDDRVPFETWWYRRDLTHVCFYAESTMRWIAGHHGWAVEFPRLNVALFARSPR